MLRSLAVLFIVLLVSPTVFAMKFNEVMYDVLGSDDDHEWFEIHNDKNQTIDMTGWKFFEDHTNHNMVAVLGDYQINAGEYVVVAENAPQFLLDYPNYTGTLIDSTFSLSNTGESIVLKNKTGQIQDNLTYSFLSGGDENGYSLGLFNGNWKDTLPTPGSANKVSNNCDWKVSISTQDLIAENPTNFSWSIRIDRLLGEPQTVTITRSIEDIDGNVIKKYNDLSHAIMNHETLGYDPNLKPGTYLLRASIAPQCNDSNQGNNEDALLVAVRSKPKKSDSSVTIVSIYDMGKDKLASFG